MKLSVTKLKEVTTAKAGKLSRAIDAVHKIVVVRVSCWRHCFAHTGNDITHFYPLQQLQVDVDKLGQ